ncbi:hypothetical protein CEXT_436251 [Caerostris extrusa]|uniref:Uncharacterized protein n=1 Tax=Caerostris extrusa TaxID=172846 RepID=A0AAV4MVV4_CAEEX|nr:hypothetical protein CEXT_436251 [Caerostris extrusa]
MEINVSAGRFLLYYYDSWFQGNQQRFLYGVWSNICMRKPFLWKWMVGLYLIGMTSCRCMSRFRLGNLYYGNCWLDHIDKYTTTAVSIFFFLLSFQFLSFFSPCIFKRQNLNSPLL